MKKTILAVLALSAFAVRAEVDKKTERTWKAKCASCHGADGKGETDTGKKAGIPNYADPAFQKSKTDQQLKDAIANGVKTDKGEMEGFKDKLDGAQIDALVSYIRSLAK
jgi:mono/diheme cytochrome c family protein